MNLKAVRRNQFGSFYFAYSLLERPGNMVDFSPKELSARSLCVKAIPLREEGFERLWFGLEGR